MVQPDFISPLAYAGASAKLQVSEEDLVVSELNPIGRLRLLDCYAPVARCEDVTSRAPDHCTSLPIIFVTRANPGPSVGFNQNIATPATFERASSGRRVGTLSQAFHLGRTIASSTFCAASRRLSLRLRSLPPLIAPLLAHIEARNDMLQLTERSNGSV